MPSEDSLGVTDRQPALLELAAEVVAAYVSRNAVPAAELPTFIAQVHSTIAQIANGLHAPIAGPPRVAAVSIKASITDEHLICLEDGLKFKSLKRHLAASHSITPQEYRKKWGLPAAYPMVAPAFAASRSNLAKEYGLGRKGDMPMSAAKKLESRKTTE